MIDHDAFTAFEHDGWAEVAPSYHDSFERVTRQGAAPLLDAVAAGPGVHLLDVACGTGEVAAEATSRGATAIGVDLVAQMIAEARKLHPETEFRRGDAESLPFLDGSFAAVVCNFGILHFAHPEQAIAEAFRVLSAGGLFAFTGWCPPEQSPYFANLFKAIQTYGDMNVPLPPGPPIFRFGDPDECRRVVVSQGFHEATIMETPIIFSVNDERDVLAPIYRGTVRARKLLLAQEVEVRARIDQAAIEGARQFRRGERIEIPMPALLVTARKPKAPGGSKEEGRIR